MGILRKKRGFTIIEVTLVIALAGLIFMMVFLVVPTLSRSSRDTTRRSNVTEFISEIKKYQNNNRGALPSGAGEVTVNESGTATRKSGDVIEWVGFYNKYLGKDFMDPDGEYYTLEIQECSGNVDTECETAISDFDYKLYVILQATCNGENAIKTSNPRNLAVLMRLEGAGIYCANT